MAAGRSGSAGPSLRCSHVWGRTLHRRGGHPLAQLAGALRRGGGLRLEGPRGGGEAHLPGLSAVSVSRRAGPGWAFGGEPSVTTSPLLLQPGGQLGSHVWGRGDVVPSSGRWSQIQLGQRRGPSSQGWTGGRFASLGEQRPLLATESRAHVGAAA